MHEARARRLAVEWKHEPHPWTGPVPVHKFSCLILSAPQHDWARSPSHTPHGDQMSVSTRWTWLSDPTITVSLLNKLRKAIHTRSINQPVPNKVLPSPALYLFRLQFPPRCPSAPGSCDRC